MSQRITDFMTITDTFKDNGSVILRVARKEHSCNGGHDGQKPVKCCSLIGIGEPYVEYVGESHPFLGGRRYHPICAEQQGLVVLTGGR